MLSLYANSSRVGISELDSSPSFRSLRRLLLNTFHSKACLTAETARVFSSIYAVASTFVSSNWYASVTKAIRSATIIAPETTVMIAITRPIGVAGTMSP